MRLIFAVVTGYVVFAVSAALLFQMTGQDPHATPEPMFALMSIVWGVAFAALAGYVASRASQREGLRPSLLVGCLIATGALVSLLLEGKDASPWSQLSALLAMAPSTLLGGIVYRKRVAEKREKSASAKAQGS